MVQKILIEKCNCAGKPVIIATQMLDSMMRNPRPTRAEASDVANAILDGTDAIMLSGETAAGKYPLESVKTMDLIARKAETAIKYEEITRSRKFVRTTTPDSISHATVSIAEDLKAAAIITATESGSTSRMIAKYRPRPQIIAVTPSKTVQRRLLLVWGVEPLYAPNVEGTDAMIDQAINTSLENGLVENGDMVVLTAGVPVGIPGTTNLLKVEIVGHYLSMGTPLGEGCVTGVVRVVNNPFDTDNQLRPEEILVASDTDADYIASMKNASVIITEQGGLTSHAAIVGLNLGIPVLVGVQRATEILQSGMLITVDIDRGLIYRGKANII